MKPKVLALFLAMSLCTVFLLITACQPAPAPSCAGDHQVSIPVTGDGRAECQNYCSNLAGCPGQRRCGNHPGPGGKPTVVNGKMTVCPCLCLAP